MREDTGPTADDWAVRMESDLNAPIVRSAELLRAVSDNGCESEAYELAEIIVCLVHWQANGGAAPSLYDLGYDDLQ